jgi:hypothetical protein
MQYVAGFANSISSIDLADTALVVKIWLASISSGKIDRGEWMDFSTTTWEWDDACTSSIGRTAASVSSTQQGYVLTREQGWSISYSHRLSHPIHGIHLGGLMRRCGSQVADRSILDAYLRSDPGRGSIDRSACARRHLRTRNLRSEEDNASKSRSSPPKNYLDCFAKLACVAVTSRPYVGDKITPVVAI